ncbi:MAG: hypothetical protein AAF804_12875 [Bacteroidota bacterium]
MKRPTIIAMVVSCLAALAVTIGYRMYNQPIPSLADQQAAYTLSAAQLLADYQANEVLADERYLDRIISVKGRVKEAPKQLEGTVVLLLGDQGEMASINCSFGPEAAQPAARLKAGEIAVVKGRCTGSLLDVNLNRCVLVGPK